MPRGSDFLADVDIVDAAGASQIIFEAETRPLLPVTEIEQVVDAFMAAANAGMFSKEPTATTKPMAIYSRESLAPGTIRYVWTVTGIQMCAYRVFLNMLEETHHFDELLQRIRLVSPAAGGSRVSRTDLLNAPFSIKTSKPSFTVRSRRNLADCRDPVIRLEFRRKISDDDLALLYPLFLAWDEVVIRGGFLSELQDQDGRPDIEAALASQQTYLAAPNTVEHLFDEFVGREAAFQSLLNMAIRLQSVLWPLESFEIE